MRLGAHVSIAGGFGCAAARAAEIGCETVQVFSRSPRQLRSTRPIAAAEAEAFRAAGAELDVHPCLVHVNYLLNPAAGERQQHELARRQLVLELERAQVLGAGVLVVHPGAHKGAGVDVGLGTVVATVDWALEHAEASDALLCLENTAGQGTALGAPFEHLGRIIEHSRHRERLAVCFDTCHAFAAGYDLRTPAAYAETLAALDAAVGLGTVRCFHLNDSKCELGSQVDRHAHIGDGELGAESFRRLVTDERLAAHPGCIETPGTAPDDARNLALLRELRQASAGP